MAFLARRALAVLLPTLLALCCSGRARVALAQTSPAGGAGARSPATGAHPVTPVQQTGQRVHPVTAVGPGAGQPAGQAVGHPVNPVGPGRLARVGGFRPAPQRVRVQPGTAVVLVYSPYLGAQVEAPTNPAPDNLGYPACQGVQDCGEGQLGHGALCDRASRGLGVGDPGVCREACRSSDDCASGEVCEAALDPDDASWSGCVAAVP